MNSAYRRFMKLNRAYLDAHLNHSRAQQAFDKATEENPGSTHAITMQLAALSAASRASYCGGMVEGFVLGILLARRNR